MQQTKLEVVISEINESLKNVFGKVERKKMYELTSDSIKTILDKYGLYYDKGMIYYSDNSIFENNPIVCLYVDLIKTPFPKNAAFPTWVTINSATVHEQDIDKSLTLEAHKYKTAEFMAMERLEYLKEDVSKAKLTYESLLRSQNELNTTLNNIRTKI